MKTLTPVLLLIALLGCSSTPEREYEEVERQEEVIQREENFRTGANTVEPDYGF